MGLRENMLAEPVGELAVRQLVAVRPSHTVAQAVEAMKQSNLGAAIIVDEAGRAVGMFNEKLLIRLLDDGADVMDEPVEKHMTTHVACVRNGDTIATLIATIHARDLRWICVCDEQGKALGISGVRGVMEYVSEHHPRCVLVQPLESKLSVDEREGA